MPPKCEPLCQFSQRLFFTTFPHPAPNPTVLNRLAAEPGNQPQVRPRGRPFATSTAEDDNATYYYFTIDDQLLYFSFFQDWGPLNIAMVYKACILIHELLEDADLAPHRLVLYSSNDPRRKANAALLMALFVMIVQRRAPWEAFHPIAETEFMPFRDAGRGPSDFNLNIQDCLWGIWKAMQNGLCDMNEFDVEDYEFYEKVENGDWNWITPNFIAFASPVDTYWVKQQKEAKEGAVSSTAESAASTSSPLSSSTNSNLALQHKLPTPFLNCLDYFERRNVKLVIRLNTELYDRQTFLDRGIDHMELYFDDGTNPTDEIVRKFIDVVDAVIENDGAIAVHCKAGLGRTGTLIGAYLIWKYGFTANEAIAFMRIIRPGSVVGPQQQYMYLKQLEWNKWAAVDEIQRQKASENAPALVTPATPPAETDEEMAALPDDVRMTTPPPRGEKGVVTTVPLPPVTPSRHVAAAAAKAKEIATPGQPRKTPTAKRVVPLEFDEIEDEDESADTVDELPKLKPVPIRKQTAPASTSSSTSTKGKTTPSGKGTPTPTSRVTRSNTAVRKPVPSAPASPVKKAPVGKSAAIVQGPRPNKIPRLAAKSGTSTKDVTQSDAPASPAKRKAGAATPSRLPTLTNKRPPPNATKEATQALTDMAQLKKGGATARQPKGDWVTTNARDVVTPADRTAGSRPGLRPVRRRRSSFSSADVVA